MDVNTQHNSEYLRTEQGFMQILIKKESKLITITTPN